MSNAVPLIPIWRPDSGLFLDSFPLLMYRLDDGIAVATKPLLVNTTIDLLGLSQNAEAICTGLMDQTDDVGEDIEIETLIFSDSENSEFLVYNLIDFQDTNLQRDMKSNPHDLGLNIYFWKDLNGKRLETPLFAAVVMQTAFGSIRVTTNNVSLLYNEKEMFLRAFTVFATRSNANRRSR